MSLEPSRQRGRLTGWKDDRGFGFIEPAVPGRRLFVHVSAFPSGRRPVDGCVVTFVQTRDERGRLQASAVRYAGSQPARAAAGVTTAVSVAAVFFVVVAALAAVGRLPVIVLVAYAAASAVTLGVYAADKAAAEEHRWRTSESTLHVLALLGGWPGALMAQQLLRHKTRKQPFRTVFWFTVVANCAALAWFVIAGERLPEF